MVIGKVLKEGRKDGKGGEGVASVRQSLEYLLSGAFLVNLKLTT